jgi:carbon monoxide dehydrogenase subunit G
MDMTGEYRIAAPREKVWAALNDAEILRQCIPGCDEIDKSSDTEFSAKVTAKVGPVKAKFGGKVTLSDLDPPNGYTITGEGSGGAAGFAKGGAKVSLTTDGADTILHYSVQANVGGKLAQIGSRLIDGTARKMAEEFFGTFSTLVAAGETAAPTEEPAPVTPAPTAPTVSGGLSPIVWVTALVIIIAALLWWFT